MSKEKREIEEFKPFDITLRVNNLPELYGLFHRLNQSLRVFYDNYNFPSVEDMCEFLTDLQEEFNNRLK